MKRARRSFESRIGRIWTPDVPSALEAFYLAVGRLYLYACGLVTRITCGLDCREDAIIEGTEPCVYDASAVLVQWLTTRTLEGCAQWETLPNGLISHLTGSMFAQFITHTTQQGHIWRLFRIRDNNGELLRTAAPAS